MAVGLEFVVQKPQQSRKRDGAAGTPFHHRWRGSPQPRAPPAPSPHLASGSLGAQATRPQHWSPPRPWGGDGKARARSPSCFLEPRLPDPQRPVRPHLRSSPELRTGPAQGRRSVPGAPSKGWQDPRAAPAPTPTHRPRAVPLRRSRPGRAAAIGAAGAAEGGKGGGPRPGAPGPCRRVPPRAPATPPAAPRRRDKAAGAAGRGPARPLPAPRSGEAKGLAGVPGPGLRSRPTLIHALATLLVCAPARGAVGPGDAQRAGTGSSAYVPKGGTATLQIVTQLNGGTWTVLEGKVHRALSVRNECRIQVCRGLREAPPGWQRKRSEGQ